MTPHVQAAPNGRAPDHVVPVHTQLAALCYRDGKSGREVLLVTSSNGRWILPKGWPMSGKSGGEAAMVEAWEEAGVKKGKLERKPVGTFIGSKFTDAGDEEPCLTKVYAIKVQKTVSDYPESDRRDRMWISPKKAAKLVTEDGLRSILKNL